MPIIYQGERMPCIHPGECAGRGACEPAGAAGQVTGENAKFSGQRGSPCAAAGTGPLPCDTGWVAGYVTGRYCHHGLTGKSEGDRDAEHSRVPRHDRAIAMTTTLRHGLGRKLRAGAHRCHPFPAARVAPPARR